MPTKLVRLNKFIADSGLCARRQADRLIEAKRVMVDGQLATLGQQVDPATAQVSVDRRPLHPVKTEHRHYCFHKPRGAVSSHRAQADTGTVYDWLKKQKIDVRGLRLAGRLDKESEGLMIFSTDGQLTNKLSHPSHNTEKTYHLEVLGELTSEILRGIKKGVQSDGELLSVKSVKVDDYRGGISLVTCVLGEGKKRHLRRIFSHFRLHIRQLKRVAIGRLRLGDLPSGVARPLTNAELRLLLQAPVVEAKPIAPRPPRSYRRK